MSVKFGHSFGLRGDIAFFNESTVMFGAGKLCLLYDLNLAHQKILHIAEDSEVSAIVACNNHIAVAVKARPPRVCLLNTLSVTKEFYLAPTSMESKEFSCLSVSADKLVAAQGGLPDWMLVIWRVSRDRKILATLSPVDSPENSVLDISFSASALAVAGTGIFKVYNYQEEKSQFVVQDKSGDFEAICWLQKENLAVGSSDGQILFFRKMEFVRKISIGDDMKEFGSFGQLTELYRNVSSLVATPHHLLCIFGGFIVLIYEGEKISEYKFLKYILPPTERITRYVAGEVVNDNIDRFIKIIVSPSCRDLVATTRDGQLLHCRKFLIGNEHQRFACIFQRQHNDAIIGIDIAQGRPLIASCSKYIAILWNYQYKTQVLRKLFKDGISSITIHPTGLYLILAFSYCCKIFSILYHGLRERRQFVTNKKCSGMKFSSCGNFFVILSGTVIKIFSSVSFSLLLELDGHAGHITNLEWEASDSKFVSCDSLGVICEWSIVFSRRIWENMATLSYPTIAINSVTNEIIGISSEKSIRCLSNGAIRWDLKTRKELTSIVFCANGNIFFGGTTDGCLLSYNFPTSDPIHLIYAHCGKVSAIKLNTVQDTLVSSGEDTFIFLWEVSERNVKGAFSTLTLLDKSDIQEQTDKLHRLGLSLRRSKTARDCNFELNCMKHDEALKIMALNQECALDLLNEKIVRVKEVMQIVLDDYDIKVDLEIIMRQNVIGTIMKLNEFYDQSDAFLKETNEIMQNYEKIMNSLIEEHAKYSFAECNTAENAIEIIKELENSLVREKEQFYERMIIKGESLGRRGLQSTFLDDEMSKSTHLKMELEKVRQVVAFQIEDNEKRGNLACSQVGFDLEEKMRAVALLSEGFERLQNLLGAKEKIVLGQDKKFSAMRRLTRQLEKCCFVLDSATRELLGSIEIEKSEIKRCREEMGSVAVSIPYLQEETRRTSLLCMTVATRVDETIDALQTKRRSLQYLRGAVAEYASMLHRCFDRGHDLTKLVEDIVLHLEGGGVSQASDGNAALLEEYDFQIEKLKKSYDIIKSGPVDIMRNKSLAELRLSRENFMILREVRDFQKEAGNLRSVIDDMEAALSLPRSGDPKLKLELVIDINRRSVIHEARKFDEFIEEQSKEIERFRTILEKF